MLRGFHAFKFHYFITTYLLLHCDIPLHLQELAVDKSRVDEVNVLALKLIGENHTGTHTIQEHQATFNTK